MTTKLIYDCPWCNCKREEISENKVTVYWFNENASARVRFRCVRCSAKLEILRREEFILEKLRRFTSNQRVIAETFKDWAEKFLYDITKVATLSNECHKEVYGFGIPQTS